MGGMQVTLTRGTPHQRAEEAGARAQHQREEAMVDICCEDFEQAIAAGIIRIGACGQAYLNSRERYWAIAFCPFRGCPRATAAGQETETQVPPAPPPTEPTTGRRLRCGICRKPGHNSRRCPDVTRFSR